jgi:hypothetical protein
MVDLHVGPTKKLFRVHKTLLCKKIPYFKKMFNGGFKESSEGVGSFPEDTEESFDILIKCVYLGTLRSLTFSKNSRRNWMENPNLLSIYTLADKLCLPELMDNLTNSYIEGSIKHNFFPNCSYIDIIWAKTRDGVSLRKYVVHARHWFTSGQARTEDNLKLWPTSSLRELFVKHPSLLTAYLDLVRNTPIGQAPKDPRTMPRCVFHEHGENEECSLKK